MTKIWCSALAAVLGLTTATLHAAEPPEFLNLPPTEIKTAPLPLDTKAPLPADPKHVPAPPPSGAYGPACSSCPAPASCGTCGTCKVHPHRLLEFCQRDHSGLEKLGAWLFFRPCQLTPLGNCCCYMRPIPEPYLYFLYPGCHEGDCGGCCKGAAACGCKSCGK